MTERAYAIGILLFEGVELLDFAGPAEVFVVACEAPGAAVRFAVNTIADRPRLRTMGGIEIVPSHGYADAPPLDVLIVPGGDMQQVTDEGIAWLKRAADRAPIVLSVCMGAFLLARAGLLDGRRVTTHRWGLERLAKAAPTAHVVEGVRLVDDGDLISTAGVTAGIDGALHVLERLCGPELRRFAATEWMEHPGGEGRSVL